MGSSEASATCLRAILRLPGLQVVGVVTQPDRPAGRGREISACPCCKFAMKRGFKEADCIKPENVNDPEWVEWLRARRPDVIAVVAFGQFLKEEILTLPKHGCVNCHFSLLPKYRGAAPVTAALLAGDELTGVSIIKMGMGMDDGPILRKAIEPIYSDDTGDTLMDRLAIAGGVTLAKTLKMIEAGTLPAPVEQEDAQATFAHKIKKTDGLIHWKSKSREIDLLLRAYTPWPGCYTFLPQRFRRKGNTGRVVVTGIDFLKTADIDPAWRGELPGTVVAVCDRGPIVRTGDGVLLLTSLKAEGARELPGAEFLRGRPLAPKTDMLLEG